MNLLTSIRELPANLFIEIDCSGDRTPLIIEGEASAEELEEAWENLLAEYLDAKDGEEGQERVRTAGEAEELVLQILTCETLLKALPLDDTGKVAEELRAHGLDYAFTPESMEEDVRKCETEMRGWKLRIDILKKQAQAGDGEEPKGRTYGDYERVLSILSTHHKRELNPAEFNTLRFAIMQRDYAAFITRQNSKSDGISED